MRLTVERRERHPVITGIVRYWAIIATIAGLAVSGIVGGFKLESDIVASRDATKDSDRRLDRLEHRAVRVETIQKMQLMEKYGAPAALLMFPQKETEDDVSE